VKEVCLGPTAGLDLACNWMSKPRRDKDDSEVQMRRSNVSADRCLRALKWIRFCAVPALWEWNPPYTQLAMEWWNVQQSMMNR
jgi:hypothetical protein